MTSGSASSSIPNFIYGTAWKESETEKLTTEALNAGFTAIDTANQRKHYFEAGVGNGISEYLDKSGKPRENLFIQTKYTYARGQDHRKPYNEFSDIATQVNDSYESSLIHLNLDFIDSYILHGPFNPDGLSTEDKEAWESISQLKKDGKVRYIGVSNFRPHQLRELCEVSDEKPDFIQNRCFAALGWDRKIRDYCGEHSIHYQGFSLLTANRNELGSTVISELVDKYDKTIPEIIFRFSQQIGMIPLTGTTNPSHMKLDLGISSFELNEEEIRSIETIAEEIPGYD